MLPVTLFLLMFGFALSVTMVAPMLQNLIGYYSLDMSQSGLIMTFQGIGGVLAIALGGVIADLTKKSKLISISFIIYSLSMIFIALSPSYIILLGLFFILGASTRMFDTVSNAFVSDVYQNHRGFYLTLLHAFFGIGAFVGPLFSTVLINRGIKWNHVFLILGIVCALMIPLYIISIRKLPAKQEAAGTGKVESIFSLIVNPKLLILCLIMFLYFGYQSGISFWLPMYMEKGLNANPLLSSFALSAFWIFS